MDVRKTFEFCEPFEIDACSSYIFAFMERWRWLQIRMKKKKKTLNAKAHRFYCMCEHARNISQMKMPWILVCCVCLFGWNELACGRCWCLMCETVMNVIRSWKWFVYMYVQWLSSAKFPLSFSFHPTHSTYKFHVPTNSMQTTIPFWQ